MSHPWLHAHTWLHSHTRLHAHTWLHHSRLWLPRHHAWLWLSWHHHAWLHSRLWLHDRLTIRLLAWHHHTSSWILHSLSLRTFEQPVHFDDRFALFVCQRADRLQVVIERQLIIVKGLFDHDHSILQRLNLAMVLYHFLRQWIQSVDVIIDVVCCDA